MSFWSAFQWYHSHADPIWPDGTFKDVVSDSWPQMGFKKFKKISTRLVVKEKIYMYVNWERGGREDIKSLWKIVFS